MSDIKGKLSIYFSKIVGSKITDIFYQPLESILGDDVFVFNFGFNNKSDTYSLHVMSFVRFTQNNKILLTSSDKYFFKDYVSTDCEPFDVNFSKTLLCENIRIVRSLLDQAKVKSVEASNVGDVCIIFDNKVMLEISIDCLKKDYEYYRLIDLSRKNYQVIVCCDMGNIVIR